MRRLDFEFADATGANRVLAQRRHRDPVEPSRTAGDCSRRICKPLIVVLKRRQTPEAIARGDHQNAFAVNVGYQTITVRHPKILSTAGAETLDRISGVGAARVALQHFLVLVCRNGSRTTFLVRSVDVACTLNSDHECGHARLRLCANSDRTAPQQNTTLWAHRFGCGDSWVAPAAPEARDAGVLDIRRPLSALSRTGL